jgi:hypothetical protein
VAGRDLLVDDVADRLRGAARRWVGGRRRAAGVVADVQEITAWQRRP